MRERVEEAESLGVRKMKAQLSAAETRVSSMEEQLDVATRYVVFVVMVSWLLHVMCVCLSGDRERATAHRTIRRNEKKIKEFLNNIEDERKQAEIYKSDVSAKRRERERREVCVCVYMCRLRRLAPSSGL